MEGRHKEGGVTHTRARESESELEPGPASRGKASPSELDRTPPTPGAGRQTGSGLVPEIVSPLHAGFDRFWQTYPRKVGKAKALEAWAKINPRCQLVEQMLETLAWQKESDDWMRDAGRYVPHPTTWLNQHRWDDEPQEVSLLSQQSDLVQKNVRTAKRVLARMAEQDRVKEVGS